jgi:hypothetical protein
MGVRQAGLHCRHYKVDQEMFEIELLKTTGLEVSHQLGPASTAAHHVNAASNFLTCAEVKFPS